MPRRRKNNPEGLPPRVYPHHGGYRYIDLNGKPHNLGREWDTEARRQWAHLVGEKPASGTVGELLDMYIAYAIEKVKDGKLSARTLLDNRAEVRNLKLSFGHLGITKLASDHIAAYLDAALDAKRGIRANREVSCLSSAYSLVAMRKRLARVNPCYGVRRNTESARTHYVEGVDLRRFTRMFAPRWMRCYIILKHLIGLRQGDMLRLTRHSITDRGIEVTLSKTGKKMRFRWTWALRIVVKAILALPEWRESQRKKPRKHPLPAAIHLFTTKDNTPLTTRGFKSAWARAQKEFGDAGHPRFWENDIRAKAGSDSQSDAAAQELLGHTNVSTTKRHYRRGVSNVKPLR